jgi:hypothetical protein
VHGVATVDPATSAGTYMIRHEKPRSWGAKVTLRQGARVIKMNW